MRTLFLNGAPVLTTTTDGGGYYTFTGLLSGTYVAQVTLPAHYASSTGNPTSTLATGPYEPGANPNNDTHCEIEERLVLAGLHAPPTAQVP